MKTSHARTLFTMAALFNFSAIVLLHPASGIAAALGLVPLLGNGAFEQIALLAIGAFGAGYWLVARNPEQNRGLVQIGLASKLGVVAIIAGHFLYGSANARTLLLASGDVAFALAFVFFLAPRRAPAAPHR